MSAQGWQFASDAGSVKGRNLADRRFAALTCYWPQPARQVRVRGPVVADSAERSRGLPGPWTGGRGRGAARSAEQPADGSRGA
ncbi:pyridoxamine 5'-phosphate oxidase family protein [Streptomyces sp. NPDC051664]|uniref:pyridoxamine 5'-phosphate oxidase family protein n=1 Tax=Streptomyces sp. NPDC051664 TaxID=3365668 RepID=UPI003787938A